MSTLIDRPTTSPADRLAAPRLPSLTLPPSPVQADRSEQAAGMLDIGAAGPDYFGADSSSPAYSRPAPRR